MEKQVEYPYRAILFDFDYTLADSSRGIVTCVNHALAAMGLSSVAAEQIHPTVGLPLEVMFTRLVPAEPATRAAEFKRYFVAHADEVMNPLTVLFPGAAETIRDLRRRGLALGIVTTKFRYRIEGVMQREGLLDAFGAIIGAEDVARLKPAPDGLWLACQLLSSAPDATLYVGDSPTDAEAAQRAGLPFVGVRSGVTSAEAFAPFGPLAVLPAVSKLPAWFDLLSPAPNAPYKSINL